MNDQYIYHEPEPRFTSPFETLPEGDYPFYVKECGAPYVNKNNNWVIKVVLSIKPGGQTIWDRPWSGTDVNGKKRDGLAEFLLAVNRQPKEGKEPDWENVAGASGICRLKVESDPNFGDRNKVAYYHRPKALETGPKPNPVAKPPPNPSQPDDLPF